MELFEQMEEGDHEQLVLFRDRETGMKAIVAIHDTRRGPSLGGLRAVPYRSEAEALRDALLLSRSMTRKFAALDLPYGGAKAVVLDEGSKGREAAMEALGRMVETLNGRYGTGPDAGTTPEDMALVRRTTSHVFGLPRKLGGPGGSGPATAAGVVGCLRACLRETLGSDTLRSRTLAVQGLGSVGLALARILVERGAHVVAADRSADAAARACRELPGLEIVAADEILGLEVDAVSPCALGGVLTTETVAGLRCKVVAGGANNQLQEERLARELHDRGILWAPDFVAGTGAALLLPSPEDAPPSLEDIETHLDRSMTSILDRARQAGSTPLAAALSLTDERLASSPSPGLRPGTGRIERAGVIR